MRQSHRGPRKRKDVLSWRKLLTATEEKQLMIYLRKHADTIPGKRIYLMCDILLNTGVRIQELVRLRVQDTPAVLGENAVEVFMGKGKKDRTIPISKRLAVAIDKYIREIRPRTLPRHIHRGDTSRPVFYSSQRKVYYRAIKDGVKTKIRVSVSLYRMIRGLAQAAGISKAVHPHMFRHTFAVNAIRSKEDGGAGIDIYALQSLMGHSSIEITAKYLHFVAGQRNGMGDRLDRSYEGYL